MTLGGPLYEALRSALIVSEPVALATVVAVRGESAGATAGEEAADPVSPGSVLGAKLVVRPGYEPEAAGTLGDEELDRVVTRDVLAALAAGPHGHAALRAARARPGRWRSRSSSSRSPRRPG